MVESASEIGLPKRLGEEEYCKNGAQDGAILAVPVRMADAGNAPIGKSFRDVVIRRDGRRMVPFSKSKRRFPLIASNLA